MIGYFLSGLVVAFGQPAWISYLAPVAAICGYALFWREAGKIVSKKRRFWVGLLWFGAIQLIQLSWMTSIEYQGFYILAVYAALAVALGAQFGLLTLLIDKLPFVGAAALWTIMEWLRLYVLCGFSWNPVGLSLAAFPLSLQAASIFGILGLSFWVILTNLAVWKKRWKAAMCLALFPYLFGFVYLEFHQEQLKRSPHLTVALVQTALLPSQKTYLPERENDFISPYEQWARITALLSNIEIPVDLVVLPESAVPFSDYYPLYPKHHVDAILRASFRERAVPIEATGGKVSNRFWMQAISSILNSDVIVGMDGKEGNSYYSSAFFCTNGSDEIERYDKQILLPMAEYLPFPALKRLTQFYGITDFFTHGKKSTLFHSKVPISASICYEETFGHLMRNGRKEGAALFVNLTNDNWYPKSRLPKQHFDLARVHAVANGSPLVRSCNAGMTSALDCLGGIVAELEGWNQPGVLVASVPLYQISTLYLFCGDAGIIFISIILLTICLVLNRKSLFVN